MNEIIKKLESFFAEQDKKLEEDSVRWGIERAYAMREAKDKMRAEGGTKALDYKKLFGICGGKTWYNIFSNGDGYIKEFMVKNAQAIAKRRNQKIVNKLKKLEINEVFDAEIVLTNDGFNGIFRINNDRCVRVESILAGGYNIQRLHQRVLVKVS